jgi:hypothetical protein
MSSGLRRLLRMSSVAVASVEPVSAPRPSASEIARRRRHDFYALLDRHMREHTVTPGELVEAAEEMWRANEYSRQEAGLRKSAARRAQRVVRRRKSYGQEAHEVAMQAAGGRNWSRGRPARLTRVVPGGLPTLGKHHR